MTTLPRRRPPRLLTGTISVLLIAAGGSSALPPSASAAPPLVSTPADGVSDLSEGSIGPRVRVVQEALIDRGATLPGGADGVYGTATTTAIRNFQQWNDLEPTGLLDSVTVRGLGLDATTAASQSTPSSSSYGTLSPGTSGDAVARLQGALLDTGLVIRGGQDGVFGPATRRALMAFQRVNGLAETGAMTERAANLLDLDSSSSTAGSNQSNPSASPSPSRSGQVNLERFPMQGYCGYGDTWGDARGSGRHHEGVDIIASSGNLLYAVADGTITTQFWDYAGRRSGNGAKLTTADGTYYVYLHMSGFAPGIAKGTKVQAGDVIGFVGNTGSSATAHLHFEIHPGGGGAINPYPYVRAIDDCSNTRARYQSSFT